MLTVPENGSGPKEAEPDTKLETTLNDAAGEPVFSNVSSLSSFSCENS